MEVELHEGWTEAANKMPILTHVDDQAISQRVNRRLGMVIYTDSLGQLLNQPNIHILLGR